MVLAYHSSLPVTSHLRNETVTLPAQTKAEKKTTFLLICSQLDKREAGWPAFLLPAHYISC